MLTDACVRAANTTRLPKSEKSILKTPCFIKAYPNQHQYIDCKKRIGIPPDPGEKCGIKYQMAPARLPTAKELADFDFAASPVNEPLIQELAGGGFLEGKRNIVLVGGTGTGKTHLAVAIARSCIRKGARGRCYNVVDLVNHLEAELRAGRQGRTADQLVRRDFVILDELGYLPFAQAGGHAPVAMDGKDLRGASKQTEDGRRMMVAAVEHDSGMVLGQVEVDSKSNEIPAVRELSSSLDLAGRIVTVDAMHAQHETARCLLGRRADYVISAIKDNQETILEDLKAIDFSDAPWHETVDKGHGRIERRRCAAVDLSGAEWDGYANLHGRRQAMRIEREILKTGKSSIEVTWSLTSLGTDRAGPEELLALVRNHWHIENRLHYVRDFTYDEDRCRAYVRHLPRNLACLTNVAIAIVRCSGRFRYLPEANRHYAARAKDALDAILIAPTA